MAKSIEMSTIKTPERDTSLLNACKNIDENLNTVQSLIKSGANVNAVTPSGRTPLMLASYLGHSDIVNFLLQNGADVDIKENLKDGTALMFAIDSINYTSDKLKILTIINLLMRHNANINAQTKVGSTALMFVCQKCNPDDDDLDDVIFGICDIFLNNKNIDLGITDNNDYTAMDYANKNCNQNIKDLFSRHQVEEKPKGGRRRSMRVKKYRRKSRRKSNKKSKRTSKRKYKI